MTTIQKNSHLLWASVCSAKGESFIRVSTSQYMPFIQTMLMTVSIFGYCKIGVHQMNRDIVGYHHFSLCYKLYKVMHKLMIIGAELVGVCNTLTLLGFEFEGKFLLR